eukprot:Sspe_Gene.5042::Locus_1656_Transcript_1_1_Confidence_1.000_Length_1043::g.5042::m.5042
MADPAEAVRCFLRPVSPPTLPQCPSISPARGQLYAPPSNSAIAAWMASSDAAKNGPSGSDTVDPSPTASLVEKWKSRARSRDASGQRPVSPKSVTRTDRGKELSEALAVGAFEEAAVVRHGGQGGWIVESPLHTPTEPAIDGPGSPASSSSSSRSVESTRASTAQPPSLHLLREIERLRAKKAKYKALWRRAEAELLDRKFAVPTPSLPSTMAHRRAEEAFDDYWGEPLVEGVEVDLVAGVLATLAVAAGATAPTMREMLYAMERLNGRLRCLEISRSSLSRERDLLAEQLAHSRDAHEKLLQHISQGKLVKTRHRTYGTADK